MTDCVRENGIKLSNSKYDFETLNRRKPNKMKKDLHDKKIKLYSNDANDITKQNGLGGKINTIMQTALFYVTKLLPIDVAMENIKKSIIKSYSRKGQKLVDSNLRAIENIQDKIQTIDTTKLELKDTPVCKVNQSEYYEEIIVPTSNQERNDIPVSKFYAIGHMPTDTDTF